MHLVTFDCQSAPPRPPIPPEEEIVRKVAELFCEGDYFKFLSTCAEWQKGVFTEEGKRAICSMQTIVIEECMPEAFRAFEKDEFSKAKTLCKLILQNDADNTRACLLKRKAKDHLSLREEFKRGDYGAFIENCDTYIASYGAHPEVLNLKRQAMHLQFRLIAACSALESRQYHLALAYCCNVLAVCSEHLQANEIYNQATDERSACSLLQRNGLPSFDSIDLFSNLLQSAISSFNEGDFRSAWDSTQECLNSLALPPHLRKLFLLIKTEAENGYNFTISIEKALQAESYPQATYLLRELVKLNFTDILLEPIRSLYEQGSYEAVIEKCLIFREIFSSCPLLLDRFNSFLRESAIECMKKEFLDGKIDSVINRAQLFLKLFPEHDNAKKIQNLAFSCREKYWVMKDSYGAGRLQTVLLFADEIGSILPKLPEYHAWQGIPAELVLKMTENKIGSIYSLPIELVLEKISRTYFVGNYYALEHVYKKIWIKEKESLLAPTDSSFIKFNPERNAKAAEMIESFYACGQREQEILTSFRKALEVGDWRKAEELRALLLSSYLEGNQSTWLKKFYERDN